MVAVNGSIISGLESGLVVALAAVLLGEIVTRAALVAIGLAYSFLIYNNVLSHVDAGWTATVLNLITPSGPCALAAAHNLPGVYATSVSSASNTVWSRRSGTSERMISSAR